MIGQGLEGGMGKWIARVEEGTPIPQGLSYKRWPGKFAFNLRVGQEIWRVAFRREWPPVEFKWVVVVRP